MTASSIRTAVVIDYRVAQGEVNWEQLEVLNWTEVMVMNGTLERPVFELTTIGDLFLVGYPTCVRCGSLMHPKDAVYLEGAHLCTECGQQELEHMQYRADKFATELGRVRESMDHPKRVCAETWRKSSRRDAGSPQQEQDPAGRTVNDDIPF